MNLFCPISSAKHTIMYMYHVYLVQHVQCSTCMLCVHMYHDVLCVCTHFVHYYDYWTVCLFAENIYYSTETPFHSINLPNITGKWI